MSKMQGEAPRKGKFNQSVQRLKWSSRGEDRFWLEPKWRRGRVAQSLGATQATQTLGTTLLTQTLGTTLLTQTLGTTQQTHVLGTT